MDNRLEALAWTFDFDTQGQLRAGFFISLLSARLLARVFRSTSDRGSSSDFSRPNPPA